MGNHYDVDGLDDDCSHFLSEMLDAKTALRVLTRETRRKEKTTKLCVCCHKHQTQKCPHHGHEKTGVCTDYSLDERDPYKTELRIITFLERNGS